MRSFLHRYINTIKQRSAEVLLRYCFAYRDKVLPVSKLQAGPVSDESSALSLASCTGFKLAASASVTFLIVLFMSLSVFAQNAARIEGMVSDENNNVLPGVSITIKGTKEGTVTDANGKFTINAKPGQTLSFTFIGYKAS